MDDAVIIAIIGAMQAITVVIITGLFNRESKRRRADVASSDRRHAMHVQETRMQIKLIDATLKLSNETVKALKDGKLNDDVQQALEVVNSTRGQYSKYVKPKYNDWRSKHGKR